MTEFRRRSRFNVDFEDLDEDFIFSFIFFIFREEFVQEFSFVYYNLGVENFQGELED